MKDSITIERYYRNFAQKKGSQHIASEYAIKKLQVLIKKFEVQNILEIGLGIGSIAGIIMKLNQNLNYSGTETNEFCLSSLMANLGRDYNRISVFSRLKLVPGSKKFDLIIIDGKDSGIELIREIISKRGIIGIEGDRKDQSEIIKRIFPHNISVRSISVVKNKSYSPFPNTAWQGGIKFIFINPNPSQIFWCIKEKVTTKLKYQIRKIFQSNIPLEN